MKIKILFYGLVASMAVVPALFSAEATYLTVKNKYKHGITIAQAFKNPSGNRDVEMIGIQGGTEKGIRVESNLISFIVWSSETKPSGEWGAFDDKKMGHCRTGDHFFIQEQDSKKIRSAKTLTVDAKDKKLIVAYN